MKNTTINTAASLIDFISNVDNKGYTDYFNNNYETVEALEEEGLVVIGNNEIFVNKEDTALEVAGYFELENEQVWDEEEQDVVNGEIVRFVSDDELQSIIDAIVKNF